MSPAADPQLPGAVAGAEVTRHSIRTPPPPVVRRLGAASFFQDVASEMVYPLLPAFLASLGGGPALLGAMESAAEATVAFVKGWAGRASDRLGREKPFVVAGYAASAATRPLLALVAMPLQLVALRIVDRIAKGIRSAPRDALLARSVIPARRAEAFAYQRGLDHLGAAVGPLVASAALAGGMPLRSLFTWATLPALCGVAIVLTLPRGERPEPTSSVRRTASDRPSVVGRRPLVAAFLFGLANASDAFLLLRAAALGAPPAALPLVWAALHVVRWAAATPGGRLADALGARRALALGWSAYAAIYALFGFGEGVPAFAVALLLYGLHAGLAEGAERAFAVELAGDAGLAGTALGAWQRAAGFGALGASLIFGALWEAASARAAFSVAALLALFAALTLALDGTRAGARAQR